MFICSVTWQQPRPTVTFFRFFFFFFFFFFKSRRFDHVQAGRIQPSRCPIYLKTAQQLSVFLDFTRNGFQGNSMYRSWVTELQSFIFSKFRKFFTLEKKNFFFRFFLFYEQKETFLEKKFFWKNFYVKKVYVRKNVFLNIEIFRILWSLMFGGLIYNVPVLQFTWNLHGSFVCF